MTLLIVCFSITIVVQLGQRQMAVTRDQILAAPVAAPVPLGEAIATAEATARPTEAPQPTPKLKPTAQPTARPTEAPQPTPKLKPTAQPTLTPDPFEAARAILDADAISNPYARNLAGMYMAQGFQFVWRTAPNGNPMYQAGYRGGTVITLTRPNEEPFGGAAIAIPLYARPGANDDNIALMQVMLEFFPGWEDGRVWLAASMQAWSDSLRNGTIGGLYSETRGEWHAELFYNSPELVVLSVDHVGQ
ncbi:MAG: hypothetical protein HGA45_21820 [Chloroflexales bacterium]|nr:hypothetical protein [Chloroflexales bacterium]